MFCPKCGSPIADNANFCMKCGQNMFSAGNAAAASPSQAANNAPYGAQQQSNAAYNANAYPKKNRIPLIAGICAAAVVLIIALVIILNMKTYTCTYCGKTVHTAYYGMSKKKIMCEECADKYWHGLPLDNFRVE